MKILLFPAAFTSLLACASLNAAILSINFGTDRADATLLPTDSTGVVPAANWNNEAGAVGGPAAVVDSNGAATTATVQWSSQLGTWATSGLGEENNGFAGADRTMMMGYLDTDARATTVTVVGLGPEFTGPGYDVYVYALGGVASGRGGDYTITGQTLIGDSDSFPSTFNQDLGVDHNDVGNYLVFRGLSDPDFTLSAVGTTPVGGTVRAPINGIQIVSIPEPATIGVWGLAALVLGLVTRRRRK
jgi:MYXO-CTERM domain-containing protein